MKINAASTLRLARFGELLLALLMIYSGIMHFKFARFVAGIVPAWLPWHLFWAYFTGTALFAAGLSIVVRKQTRLAATLLGALLTLFVLLIHAPSMINSITHKPEDIKVLWSFNGTGGINNALKDVALTISAFLLALTQRTNSSPSWNSRTRTLVVFFALVMVIFGVEHFFYTNYTPGVPSWSFVSFWIPWRLFWGYATGAAMLICGAMILFNQRQLLAAITLGWMILSVAALTYLFRLAAGEGSYGELTNTMKDLAVAGGALISARFLAGEDQRSAARKRESEAHNATQLQVP